MEPHSNQQDKSIGINTVANNVLEQLNNLEGQFAGMKKPKAKDPAANYVSNSKQRGGNKPPAQLTDMELSGSSIQLQGQKLPGVLKQQAKNLDKVKQEKTKYKDAI